MAQGEESAVEPSDSASNRSFATSVSKFLHFFCLPSSPNLGGEAFPEWGLLGVCSEGSALDRSVCSVSLSIRFIVLACRIKTANQHFFTNQAASSAQH